MACGLLVSGSSCDDTQDSSTEGFSSNFREYKNYGLCQLQAPVAARVHVQSPDTSASSSVVFFITGLNLSSTVHVPMQNRLFQHTWNTAALMLLERSLPRKPEGQQAEVDRALGPGTHPVVSQVPVTSRAQCISFQGSLSLPRPGGRHGEKEGSPRSWASAHHTEGRQAQLYPLSTGVE